MRPGFQSVLQDLNVTGKLARFEPTIIGTPPLGIDVESSDIDIACTHDDLQEFGSEAAKCFDHLNGFRFEHVRDLPDPAVRAFFSTQGWDIELFCQTLPIQEQWGVRHFLIEKRLLEIQPKLKSLVIQLKRSGLKTEPAFAAALGLDGDPFKAMLLLEPYSDHELKVLTTTGIENFGHPHK